MEAYQKEETKVEIFQRWIDFVIKNCNCSNIQELTLDPTINNTLNDQSLLEKFAFKFSRLNRLILNFCKSYPEHTLLWQLLQKIIEKNNGTIEVHCGYGFDSVDAKELGAMITDNNLKCDRIKMTGLRTNKTIRGFTFGGVIGSEGLLRVYQARHAAYDHELAIKFSKKHHEIEALNKLNHQNIINLLMSLLTETYFASILHSTRMLVFQNMKNGNLNQYLQYKRCFDLGISKRFFDQIVSGLDYLHNKVYIAQKNLCPANLLLDDNFNIKMAGFGSCEFVDSGNDKDEMKTTLLTTVYAGTEGYIAPELCFEEDDAIFLKSRKEIVSCDIFSLGIILWKMLIGIDVKPFENLLRYKQWTDYPRYKLIMDKKYDTWWKKFENTMLHEYYSNDNLKNLFLRMFDASPTTRIIVSGIKKHDWYMRVQAQQNGDYVVNQFLPIRIASRLQCI